MDKIHKKIYHLRIAKGYSMTEVAKKLKMTFGNYAKIERGDIELKYSVLEEISKLYGISVASMIDDETAQWEKLLAEKDKQILELQEQIIALLKASKRG